MLCRSPLRIVLFAAALLLQASCRGSFVSVPLTNAEMTDFASGVALNWSSFTTGSGIPPGLLLYADSVNFRSGPTSQGISRIDASMPPGSQFGVGLYRTVNVTPGRIYFLIGFQDLFDPNYTTPPAPRYAHFFGIAPYGDAMPPQPFSMGGVSWMAPGQWFYNDVPGNSTQIGGLHRCMAAWAARSSLISLWTGVWAYGDAAASPGPTVFDTDSFMLFEYDNSVRGLFANPGLDAIDNLTPGYDVNDVSRISLPIYWAPVGGGIGQKESFYTEAAFKRTGSTGSAGLRIYNHRGCLTRGITQKISVPAGNYSATFSAYCKFNKTSGTIAKVGIDPTGGDDINSPSIVWGYYSRTDETWEQVSVTTPCAPQTAVSVFLVASSQAGTTGSVYYADFDDTALTFVGDITPPQAFVVTAETPTTLLGHLTAAVSPAPADPESGISSLQYAIGTTPGGQEVRAYTALSTPTSVSATGLSLIPGQTYYITVRATNGVGLSTTVSSNPILCSPRPYIYSWSQVQHLSRTSFNADNVRLVAGANGNVCAVWRESNDASWNGSDSRVMLRERTGAGWGDPVKANVSPNAWWPDAAWSGTTLGVSYLSPGSQLQNSLLVASRAGGGAFVEQFVSANVSALPRLAQTPGAAFVVGCNLNPLNDPVKGMPSLLKQNPTWTSESLPGGAYSGSDMRVCIVAQGSTIHCLWGRLDAGQPALYYCARNAQGAYSSPRLVASGTGAGSIAVGSTGELHAVYASGGGVWYTRSADGVTWDMARYLGVGSNPCVAVDGSNSIHVLFFAPTGAINENNVPTVTPVHMYQQAAGWSLPTAICPSSCTSGIWAQEPGNLIADSTAGLHFAWSCNPHDRGGQGEQFQGYYWIDYYTTTPVEPEGGGIVQAKLWGDDAAAAALGYPPSKVATLEAAQVTATGTFKFAVQAGQTTVWKSVPYFCIGQQDRASAIKVIAGDAQDSAIATLSVAPGDLADVSGPISTTNGERTLGYLTSGGLAHGVSFVKSGVAAEPISPLFMGVGSLGGSALGPTLGVTGGVGANNVGLLVAIAGMVVMTSTDERGVRVLYVDDGSLVACGVSTGCKVYAPGSPAQVGDFVTVIGVPSIELYDQDYIRVMMPRDSNSVRILPQ